jgi:hypothetical protein
MCLTERRSLLLVEREEGVVSLLEGNVPELGNVIHARVRFKREGHPASAAI